MRTGVQREAWLAEVEERAALARDGLADAGVAGAYASHAARQDVPELVSYVRELLRAEGGDLGVALRDALRERLLVLASVPREAQQIAALHPDVRLGSLMVSLVGGALTRGAGQVIVDVRLLVGGEP